MPESFIEYSESDQIISLSGDWNLSNAQCISVLISRLPNVGISAINASSIRSFDTAGAVLLGTLLKSGGSNNSPINITGLIDEHSALLSLVNGAVAGSNPPQNVKHENVIEQAGRWGLSMAGELKALVEFIGETGVSLGRVLRHPGKLRFASITRHIGEAGISSVPIIAMIAFLISVVLAYQGAHQLRTFGAEIFTVNLVGISVLREMGTLLTAIMVAGRSGSAFTAEIGVMQVNQEVDAMRVIGVNPFEALVLPRVIALVLALPILTFIADIMGLLGGGVISLLQLNIGLDQYLTQLKESATWNDFFVGMVKAPVFAFLIATISCMRGLQATGSAESVGRLTTASVVESIFMVLLADALFSILFMKLGI